RPPLMQHGAAADPERRGVDAMAFEASPLARKAACEVARMAGDARGEALRVACDVPREVLGGVADVVPVGATLAMRVIVPTVVHDRCSFRLAGSRSRPAHVRQRNRGGPGSSLSPRYAVSPPSSDIPQRAQSALRLRISSCQP